MEIYFPNEDSYLILKHIKKFARGRVLDMGTGTGILAVEASKYSKEVVAVDINKEAIEYAKEKNKKMKNIEWKVSNLFENVDGKFDLIIFNPPYLPKEENEPKELSLSICGGERGYELLFRFLKEAKKYLKKNGVILIVISSLTNFQKVKEFASKYYKFEVLEEMKIPFEKLYVIKLSNLS